MKTRLHKIMVTALVGLTITGMSITTARALDLGDILKVGGITLAVSHFRKPINEFINKALGERDAEAKGATKVVAILSVGSGGYIGAAQVVGVPSAVQSTQGVVQVEIPVGDFRATGYVPVSTKTPTKSPTRVKGVGVSAVIQFRI